MNLQLLVIGGLALTTSIPTAIFPRRRREITEAAIAIRKAELAAGAPERFFEEGRAIDAYPPPRTDRGWLIKGVVLSLAGISCIILGIIR